MGMSRSEIEIAGSVSPLGYDPWVGLSCLIDRAGTRMFGVREVLAVPERQHVRSNGIVGKKILDIANI